MSTSSIRGWRLEVGTHIEFDAPACMNCGVCTAVCPMGLEVLPRRLFLHVLLGMEEQVCRRSRASTFAFCARCEVNCPAGVHIAENVRSLRHHINRKVFGV